ncbi:phosphoribosylaminoimidazolesuccinocarboxamide synthase [Aureimonas glaciei]|uniref:phosphoribosylaminoimidazolesuccinocarboxamide synthase n=1 Tax=Aureimonas glaciei TaxID=1776957 RepID=UPI00166D5421|nr:phosphoribosylaminoimidazolesuccinocarboxamide synthase [Aureimonas glaciei]
MKRWSTKSLRLLVAPAPARAGIGIFDFTDDYSVFHFSKMPDRIPDKGEVIARMGHASLEIIERAGIRTHLIGKVSPTSLRIRLLNVLDPARGELSMGDTARLVPLQVIYRNRLGPGASVYRRVAAGRLTAQEIGLDRLPPPGTALSRPIIEFTTKLENIDRFVTGAEARALSCLSPTLFERLKAMTLEINSVLCDHAEACGLILEDGKLEFGVDEDGELLLVDVAGTPDENRFEHEGFDVSKQVLRDYYHRFGLEAEIQRLAASGVARAHWPVPQPLPPRLLDAAAEMYRALCERWTGEPIWQARPLGLAARQAAAALAEATDTAPRLRARHP